MSPRDAYILFHLISGVFSAIAILLMRWRNDIYNINQDIFVFVISVILGTITTVAISLFLLISFFHKHIQIRLNKIKDKKRQEFMKTPAGKKEHYKHLFEQAG